MYHNIMGIKITVHTIYHTTPVYYTVYHSTFNKQLIQDIDGQDAFCPHSASLASLVDEEVTKASHALGLQSQS